MRENSDRTGLLLRTEDDTTFFVPLEVLMQDFRLPDELQKGSAAGDELMAALDRCSSVVAVRNAIIGSDFFEFDMASGSPVSGKQKFNASAIQHLQGSSPAGGKQKYVASMD